MTFIKILLPSPALVVLLFVAVCLSRGKVNSFLNEKNTFVNNNQQRIWLRTRPICCWLSATISSSDGVEVANADYSEDYFLRFSGVGRLYSNNVLLGKEKEEQGDDISKEEEVRVILNRLVKATVVIVGVGGVGSWASEALCRSGIGSIVLVDLDDVCISNTNRQVHALSSTVGKFKIEEMKQRLHLINPMCNVTLIHDFVSKQNVESILEQIVTSLPPDEGSSSKATRTKRPLCVLDAIDGKIEKAAIIATCAAKQIPIVTVGGSAGKTNPTCIVLQDLARVQDDRLLFACRKILRQEYGFKKPNILKPKRPAKKWHIMAVYSTERRASDEDSSDNALSSSLRICDSSLGTACYVTGTFGFVAAGAIIDMVANDNLLTPKAFEKN
jgi:tRNA A37 threonylcarbamoyladenosine dehydratase